MGLANKSVVLYQSVKIRNEWRFRPVDEDSSHLSDGPFYVSWYDGKKKRMDHATWSSLMLSKPSQVIAKLLFPVDRLC